jgi:hypothetical protein
MRKVDVDVDAFCQDVDEPFSQDRFRVFDSVRHVQYLHGY